MAETRIDIEQISASGTPSSTTYLRGDSSWATAGGSSGPPGITTVTTAAGTTTLTNTSNQIYIFTGTMTQTMVLPTTSVVTGDQWMAINYSTGAVTVEASDTTTVVVVAGGAAAVFTANTNTPVTYTDWDTQYGGVSVTTGKILEVANSLILAGTDNTTLIFPSGGISATAAANTIPSWDGNVNLSANSVFEGFTTQATAAGTTTLSITSTPIQVFTGTSTQTVKLPTTSVPAGAEYTIINQSTEGVTVQSSGANTIAILPGYTSGTYPSAVFTALVATPTTAANWINNQGGAPVAVPAPLATATSTAAIAVNATQVQLCSVKIPALSVPVGTAFKLKGWGTTSSATTGNLTWEIHCGSLNTTGDGVVASGSCYMAASWGSYVDGMLTIRATSATTGSCMASLTCFGGAVPANMTGTSTNSASMTANVNAAINSAVAGILGQSTQTANVTYTNSAVSYVSLSVAASAGTFDIQNAYVTYAGA